MEFGKRPRVTVRLESGLVDFTRIMEQTRGEKKAETGKAGGSRQALFSDEPLPFDLLDAVDADIAFNARNIKARDAELEFGQLALRLDAGDLRVEKLEATYRGRQGLGKPEPDGRHALRMWPSGSWSRALTWAAFSRRPMCRKTSKVRLIWPRTSRVKAIRATS